VEQTLVGCEGVSFKRDRKGGLLAAWNGNNQDAPRAISAHVDTLGAMVKEIKPNGRLRLSAIGGLTWNAVETESCTVFAQSGKAVRGSLILVKASTHVHGKDVKETLRSDETLEVRLDERTKNADETRSIGISVGDFVAFDPRAEITNGFVRSRHLDDKAGVACLVTAIKSIFRSGLAPRQKTYAYFSSFEEVGHGGKGSIPVDAVELLVVDMAAVGEGQNSDEFHASICLKDGGGPYHHEFTNSMRKLADDYNIPYLPDIYVHYGSDGTAYWGAGGQAAVALIGPGVDASHNYERTHVDALLATTRWIMAYLLN
jgi:putative aminopeptidase FrvX